MPRSYSWVKTSKVVAAVVEERPCATSCVCTSVWSVHEETLYRWKELGWTDSLNVCNRSLLVDLCTAVRLLGVVVYLVAEVVFATVWGGERALLGRLQAYRRTYTHNGWPCPGHVPCSMVNMPHTQRRAMAAPAAPATCCVSASPIIVVPAEMHAMKKRTRSQPIAGVLRQLCTASTLYCCALPPDHVLTRGRGATVWGTIQLHRPNMQIGARGDRCLAKKKHGG